MNEEADRVKTLPPALRLQKRYVIFEAISEHPIEYKDLSESVWMSLLDFSGELGASDARIWMIMNLYDDKAQKGVIQCSIKSVETLRASLALIQIVSENKCIVKVLGVTGTLKSARDKYMGG